MLDTRCDAGVGLPLCREAVGVFDLAKVFGNNKILKKTVRYILNTIVFSTHRFTEGFPWISIDYINTCLFSSSHLVVCSFTVFQKSQLFIRRNDSHLTHTYMDTYIHIYVQRTYIHTYIHTSLAFVEPSGIRVGWGIDQWQIRGRKAPSFGWSSFGWASCFFDSYAPLV